MPELLYRQFTDVETRADPGLPGFSGYAAHFNTVDGHGTAMAPGAFKRTIRGREDRIPVLWQHNPDWAVGRHVSIKEDPTGLRVDVEVIDDGAEGSVLLKRLRGGVPLSMSFGFQTKQDRAATKDDALHLNGWKLDDVRVITEVKYWESSAVTFPSNENAVIDAVRSQKEADALSILLADLEAGVELDAHRDDLLQRLVALAAQRPGPGGTHPDHSTREQAPHADDIDVIALASFLTRKRLSLSGVLDHAYLA
jgi:HK97 family phage prohead protease